MTSVIVATASAPAATPEKCAAAKQKAAAVAASSKVKCHGKAILRDEPVDAACLAKAETKLQTTWTRIEAAGGCVTTGDANDAEALVDQFVAGLVTALPTVTTTTTTTTTGPTTSCPSTSTIPACANICSPTGLCAPGQTCDASCQCVGPPVPCGDLPNTASGNVCAYGQCPAGQMCGSIPIPGACGRSCGCS